VRAFRDILSLRSARVSLAIALIASIAMSFLPLLAVHGAESALVLGVLLPLH
jgi:uncharacterized protein (DUF2062 family)